MIIKYEFYYFHIVFIYIFNIFLKKKEKTIHSKTLFTISVDLKST